jgi:hypothetical protein
LWLLKRRVFFTAFTFFLLSFPVFFFTIVQEIFFRWQKPSKRRGKKNQVEGSKGRTTAVTAGAQNILRTRRYKSICATFRY